MHTFGESIYGENGRRFVVTIEIYFSMFLCLYDGCVCVYKYFVSEPEAVSKRLHGHDLCWHTRRRAERLCFGGRRWTTCGLAVDGNTDKNPSQLSGGLHQSFRDAAGHIHQELASSDRHHDSYVLCFRWVSAGPSRISLSYSVSWRNCRACMALTYYRGQ